MLEEALEHLVKGIVDHDEDVVVRRRDLRRGTVLEVRVHPEDLGRVIGRSGRTASAIRRVIGRSGRTASAIRTVLSAISSRGDVRVDIVDTDRR